jgi:hypothetical protein
MSMPVKLADLEITRYAAGKHDVAAFNCGDSDLNDFLKSDAGRYEKEHLSHTRLAFLNGELVSCLPHDIVRLHRPQDSRKEESLGPATRFPSVDLLLSGNQDREAGSA